MYDTSQIGETAGQWPEFGEPRQEDRQEIWQTVLTLHRFQTALEEAHISTLESGRPHVARLCGDLETIVDAEKKLLLRRSPFAQPIGQAVQQTIQQGIQELQQVATIPEVQEALSEAQQSTSAIARANGIISADQVASAAGFQPMYGTARQLGGGFGQYQQSQQFRQDVRQTVMTINSFETALQFARMRAVQDGRLRTARVCADLAIAADLEKKLVLRGSPFAEPIGQVVLQTIQQGIQELQQAADDPEVREALSYAQPAIEAIRSAVGERFGPDGQGRQNFQQPQLQQWGRQDFLQ
jgi:hypothetical protein